MALEALDLESKAIGPISLRPIFSERVWGVETLPQWYQQPEAWVQIATGVGKC